MRPLRQVGLIMGAILIATRLWAAVGCDLNEPDRDVKRLFPASTSYRTEYLSVQTQGGTALLARIESRLGDHFTGLYETVDVPYTLYRIYQGKQLVGFIHGVNQKGVYGGLQVFLALDPQGQIRGFYFQKLTSRNGAAFRSPEFAQQFVGLDLEDFMAYDPVTHAIQPESRVRSIQDPAPAAEKDFFSTLRGVKKNLILMDELVLNPVVIKGLEKGGKKP